VLDDPVEDRIEPADPAMLTFDPAELHRRSVPEDAAASLLRNAATLGHGPLPGEPVALSKRDAGEAAAQQVFGCQQARVPSS
jgi:hypothetical protein